MWIRNLSLLSLCLVCFGCYGSHGKSVPFPNTAGGKATDGSSIAIYNRYIDVNRVELYFEFGHVPNHDEILDWDKRLCEE